MATIDLKSLFKTEDEIDQKVFMALLKALKEKHQEGFDYLKFKQSVKNLEDLTMDEETSIKSAFMTASTMGLTKPKLLKSITHYKNILSKERESFADAMRNQLKNKVEAKKIEAEKLSKKIEDYKLKIRKMQEEMSLYQQKIDSVDEEMEKARSKIESTRDKFEKTYHAMAKVVEDDQTKIDTIL